ncbi:MAG: hypothetical protein PWR03_2306 [Tenuifilum sp.]|jgi:hypothetical protein|uniref:hypothetical protein n=1 Tax=Tenuifilum sp. TaxID=2760880 RepID=UPI0024ABF865|nr:hypothetical protein [Tenuifilum sp.]MDI3528122.1 hypothetical protein [Tenuifilum sp.]
MEFFRIVKVRTTEQAIHRKLTISNLDQFCSDIFNLEILNESESKIGGIWGEFTLNRMEIKGGVRFSLLECPNALCWTITTGYPPDRNSIIIHLTINRTKKQEEFIDEINEFLDDMSSKLMQYFQ